MDILKQFTLLDVFLVAVVLVTASIIRIFYDSYRERKRLEELDELISVYDTSMNMYDEGILILSDSQDILFENKELERIFGVPKEEITIEFLQKKVLIRTQDSLQELGLLDVLKKHAVFPDAELRVGNRTLAVTLSSNYFRTKHNDAENSSWHIVTIRDMTAQNKLREKMKSTVLGRDVTTGLPVRQQLLRDLHTLLAAKEQGSIIPALGMLAVDEYHHLQSQYGTEKIDFLLRSISKTLSEALVEDETLYQFDHDSFVIVFANCDDAEKAKTRLSSFEERMRDIAALQKVKSDTASTFCNIEKPYPRTEKILDQCLRGLYRKNTSEAIEEENTLSFNKDRMDSLSIRRNLGKREFEKAIKSNRLLVYYQPIYALKDDSLIGLEALSRLNDEKEGLLMPDFFLQKAIECNMMTEITSHLLDRILSQKRFWFMQMKKDLDTTINLSLSDIKSGIFSEVLEKKILEHMIDPKTITIDISEEILEVDYEAVFEECYMLNKLGVKLAIDHFGKGSISLRNIGRLPLHTIKIDGSIIEGIEQKEDNLRLASGIVSMGRKLDFEVGATFVDTNTIKILLGRIGCQFAQGNYLGKAAPAFEITPLLLDA